MEKKIKISNENIKDLLEAKSYDFPKYTTQIINLVNGNAQGTRPSVVGQMSELIKNFPGNSLSEWVEWYSKKKPDSVEKATDLIFSKLEEMKNAVSKIDKPMIEAWVKDLVHTKTYCGLKFQDAILSFLSKKYKMEYTLASKEDESKGIDGYLNKHPVQIKSVSYKTESHLSEIIEVPIIYYDKKKDGITIEFDMDRITHISE